MVTTYAEAETSPDDGEPVDLYEFAGSNQTYRYTSGLASVEYGGQTFTPAAVSRGDVGARSTIDAATMTVTIATSAELVQDFGFGNPPRSLNLKIYRLQTLSGEARVIWDGRVIALAPRGRRTEVRSSSHVGERMATSIPSVSFQRLCNHFLYDDRCRVDRTVYDSDALVSGVSADGRTVTVNSIGIAPDQWYRSGEVVRALDSERRLVIAQVGAVLTLSAPFRTLANGDALTLYAGCDHGITMCSDKFNNVPNFGGHPSIPQSNPFILPLRLLRRP